MIVLTLTNKCRVVFNLENVTSFAEVLDPSRKVKTVSVTLINGEKEDVIETLDEIITKLNTAGATRLFPQGRG